MRALLKERVDVNVRAHDGSTALLWAAHWNDLATADLLVRAGANVNAANDLRMTPLSLACTNASAPLVDLLLKAGATPNTAIATGETPIMTCAGTGVRRGIQLRVRNTLSWLTPTLPLMSENDPRVVFERLFGSSDSTDARVRSARLRQDRSILDSVTARVRQLQQKLGAADNTKVSDYLESLRDVERRIQKAEEQSSRELPEVDRPVGIPDSFDEHVTLLYDLQVLAYQCDLTRVITFMSGREQSARTYPQLGISDPHHQLTHHQNDPEKLEKCTKIQKHHVELFTAYLEKLCSIPDGDGSLLDHIVILFGAGLSNSDRHTHSPLPTVVVGGPGTLKGGRHLVFPEGTPLTNLHVTLLDKVGVPIEKLGDSTGTFKELSIA
jgi:hypothetical protein